MAGFRVIEAFFFFFCPLIYKVTRATFSHTVSNLCKPAAGEGQQYILYVSVLNIRGLLNI